MKKDQKPDDALANLRSRYMEAFNAGDANAVADLHTRDSIHMPAGMRQIVGRSSIRDVMAESFSGLPKGLTFEFEAAEVRIADTWAIERGTTNAIPPFPAGKYVMMYEREPDGQWRIAWTISNHDGPLARK